MPIIKRFDNSYDFKVETPESEENFGQNTYMFLKQNLCVIETFGTDSDGQTYKDQTQFVPIIEHPEMGLCWWDEEDKCWKPEDDERVAKAYSDFIADKHLLENPQEAPIKRKGKK